MQVCREIKLFKKNSHISKANSYHLKKVLFVSNNNNKTWVFFNHHTVDTEIL